MLENTVQIELKKWQIMNHSWCQAENDRDQFLAA